MDKLTALSLLNTALAYGAAGLPVARVIGRILESAQREDRALSSAEWREITAMANDAEDDLARAIEQYEA